MEPPPRGEFFDLMRLHEVPDVPQRPLPRYVPPQGVSDRVADLVSNPRVHTRLGEAIDEGAIMGGPRWYNTEPLRRAFLDELGPRRGATAFQQYMDMVAASSPGSKPHANIRNASYYYSLLRRGEDMPARGTSNPQPYGHKVQQLHQLNATGWWRRAAGTRCAIPTNKLCTEPDRQ
jgi:hypothetical protein